MTKMLRLVDGFLESAAALGPLPDWRVEIPSSKPEGPLSAYRILPEALYDFASRARRESKCGDAPAAQLLAFAAAADGLAWELKWGDVVAQEKTSKALPRTYDYAVSSLADAVRIAQRLDAALGSALKQSKRCGGPVPPTHHEIRDRAARRPAGILWRQIHPQSAHQNGVQGAATNGRGSIRFQIHEHV
ncbi:hypothetical protein QCM80_43225 [Bradyrhizobium sp. SSUT112]|uniref:hypothetical protein n=1 Tax=Bradyrhizobium sp. SSUT112 TaxID=3040604 RepID=UPI00244ADC36|nr:hypothetical protein [Bradyrhizobium sp. SSUT112]MDH2357324.1 hypothetical protein [Bradyrhizobium sp. SSUT112]